MPQPAIDVEAPARVRFGHAQTRLLGPGAGAQRAFRNIRAYPLLTAVSIKRPKIAMDEFAAGEVYRVAWEMRFPKGVDMIARIGMVVSGGKRDMTDRQINAGQFLKRIDTALKDLAPPHGEPHLTIIRSFCGDALSARIACHKAGIKDPRETWGAIRLALSKLSTAISRTGLTFSED